MKFFIALMLIAIIRSKMAASINFGLLIFENGPIYFRQTTTPKVFFQIEVPSQSKCTPGKIVCNEDFGFFPGHSGLDMCSVSRNCNCTAQICLRKFQNGSKVGAIEGCCKPGVEAWALSGAQETSGTQFPTPRDAGRFAVTADGIEQDTGNT